MQLDFLETLKGRVVNTEVEQGFWFDVRVVTAGGLGSHLLVKVVLRDPRGQSCLLVH